VGERVARRRARRDDRLVGLSIRVSREEREAIKSRALARGVTVAQLLVRASLELPLAGPQGGVAAGALVAGAAAAAPRRPVGEGRAQVNLKLSVDERDELQAWAVERGVSVSALLLNSALERALPPPRAVVGPEERAVIDRAVGVIDDSIAELGRIGNNINQLAHVANISGDVTMERRLRDALAENSDAIRSIREVADELARSVVR
jgi:uncharacterized protein (DUF1778 family)